MDMSMALRIPAAPFVFRSSLVFQGVHGEGKQC